jgi:S-DNA-T family DNA segregation ATPase FtsK/SpoIIIE
MSAVSVRVALIPGKNVIGIEIPNETREIVYLKELIASEDYEETKHKIPLILGKDISGKLVIADLAKMPHLLVAGTTGSGKSVAINTMILSLLYKLPPEKCRLIMIDPKMLELSGYDNIPHLLTPVVVNPKKAIVALKWAVHEMEERYRAMSKLNVRSIDAYNKKIKETIDKKEVISDQVQTGFDKETGKPIFETKPLELKELPYIVIIVDEFADLMMVAGKEIDACIQRLAQMARAAGIHMIMATQRPSVDVVTGTIKANFPTRISFAVSSKIDSRTILGEGGAEQLLGMGDMLYMASGLKAKRVHGPFVDDKEVERVTTYLKKQSDPNYITGILDESENDDISYFGASNSSGSNLDELYDEAVQIVLQDQKASTSYIQRKLSIGYNRAAKIIDDMEERGVISSASRTGKREILN